MSDKALQSKFDEVEHKLLILYLIDTMNIPISYNKISEFALDSNYMNFFTLQSCLSELETSGYVEKITDNTSSRYTVTGEGLQVLEYFEKNIPQNIRNKINKFVEENKIIVKKDYEITANIFQEHSTGDFIVKCGAYDDEVMLMELNISVVSNIEARRISRNWKNNVNSIFNMIISEVTKETEEDKQNK